MIYVNYYIYLCARYLNGDIKIIIIKSGMSKNENYFKVRESILRKKNLHERIP